MLPFNFDCVNSGLIDMPLKLVINRTAKFVSLNIHNVQLYKDQDSVARRLGKFCIICLVELMSYQRKKQNMKI